MLDVDCDSWFEFSLVKTTLQIHQVLTALIAKGIIELNVKIPIICLTGFPWILTQVPGNNSVC